MRKVLNNIFGVCWLISAIVVCLNQFTKILNLDYKSLMLVYAIQSAGIFWHFITVSDLFKDTREYKIARGMCIAIAYIIVLFYLFMFFIK